MAERNFRLIAREMSSREYFDAGKVAQKLQMDEWFARVLDILETREQPITDWEMFHLREALSHSRDGLFLLAWHALNDAIATDAAPPLRPQMAEDIKDLTLGHLLGAADWLRNQPPQLHPIFFREIR